MDSKTGVFLQTVIELLVVKKQVLNDGSTLTVLFDLLFAIEKDLAPQMQVATCATLRPVSNQAMHSFWKSGSAESLSQELI